MEISNQSLANELLRLSKIDQTMRMKVIELGKDFDPSVDLTNQTRLMEIVINNGWPTISQVGRDASRAAWLIVQHAPSLEFMEKCLRLMKTYPASEVDPKNTAFLEDRVLMLNDKPQIYGTQFQGTGTEMHVYQIEDHQHVDERRASVGLGTFADNLERIRKLYKNL